LFNITGIGIKSYTYDIYNRWGELIYSKKIPLPPLQGGIPSSTSEWDGTFKGEQAPEGVYIYKLDVIDVDGIHHYLSGNITLMR